MRIMVDIGHPAHVHFFKNFIWEMEKRGHQISVTARDKDVAIQLLKTYNIKHTVIGKMRKGKLNLIREWVGRDFKIYSMARKFRPHVLMGISNPCAAHVAKIIRAKSIVFTDTEHAKFANRITFPLASKILTPSCFTLALSNKHIRYNGYHELAYLHPKYFKPNPAVLDEIGLSESDKFFVIRFVSWGASHDIGHRGFTIEGKRKLVSVLSEHGKVLITSEAPLPEEFEEYRITVPPEKIHDLLYYATMYVGEGATMASECAILGTPAIRVSSFPKNGYIEELESKYDLVHSFLPEEDYLGKIELLLRNSALQNNYQQKRAKVLNDKIDVTQYIIDLVEGFTNE
jgi:uncharacterized protein